MRELLDKLEGHLKITLPVEFEKRLEENALRLGSDEDFYSAVFLELLELARDGVELTPGELLRVPGRVRKRLYAQAQDFVSLTVDLPDRNRDPTAQAEYRETIRAMEKVMMEIDDDELRLVTWMYLSGQSAGEIVAEVKMPKTTVYRHIKDAKMLLKRAMRA